MFVKIDGFDNYEVSELGEIRSLMKSVPKILNLDVNPSGYTNCCLYRDKKKHRFLVHRLVAEAFIPNPENKPQVNHKNGTKTDNRVENLEWCTYEENLTHAVENGLRATGERVSTAKLKEDDVRHILKLRREGNPIKSIANKYDVSEPCIQRIIYGISWKHIKCPTT